MTTTDRIHQQSFCYDDEVPPSVPAGKPLRGGRQQPADDHASGGIRRTCRRTLASLRGRLGSGE